MIKLFKDNEKDNIYFIPLIDYNVFKWNISYFDADGELL